MKLVLGQLIQFWECNDPWRTHVRIWIYNKIEKTNQSNAKLLFYNPDLAGSDFRLLHSTVRGERNNPRWEPELYKRAATEIIGNNTIDATRVRDNFHRRAREYFEN